nr:hybrid sensor histidine kinase/response regulator [Nitratireductor luteus]
MLADASTAEEAERLPVLDFQIGLSLAKLKATAEGLDARLRTLLLEQATRLEGLVEGPDSIIDARRRELALIGEGEEGIARTASLSAELTAAVDELGSAARGDIGKAIQDALSVQRSSTRALVAVVVLSIITSALIVWLYVGGHIARRLAALSEGMLAIADGRLRTPVAVTGTDEIAAMAQAVEIFRRNAIELGQLLEERKETATRLEQLVAERTRELNEKSRQLEAASKYKSHFLASASHDLRQPLHALNLFVAQLRAGGEASDRDRLVERIDAAVNSMNELFESLLDMSKLEAGAFEPNVVEFPVERALECIEMTFAGAAKQKGLRLSVVRSDAWVRSDPVLLERILMNLVSNAVRCTERGGVVIGCRRRGESLRIDICDSGPGIPVEEQGNIFSNALRPTVGRSQSDGLGLGLTIVERLGRLLDHAVEFDSRPGQGSRFSVWIPFVAEPRAALETAVSPAVADPARDKLVVVIDDDPLVLEGMRSILQSWGCRLLSAESEETARSKIRDEARRPDLIISDYRLANGRTGIQAIEQIRCESGAEIPAFLISGDTAPEGLREARDHGIHLLHKPVLPMQLRAMLSRSLKPRGNTEAPVPSME